MKQTFTRFVLVSMLVFLLAGCGGFKSLAGTPQKDTREVIRNYYAALIAHDYTKATEYVSTNYYLAANLKPEDASKLLKETLLDRSVTIKEYQIAELKAIDETHTYAKVLYKTVGWGHTSVDEMIVVLEDGKWKLDWSMVTKSTPISGEKFFDVADIGKVSISHIIAHKTLDGMLLSVIINNNTDSYMRFGWPTHGKFELKTNKGIWRGTANKFLRLGPHNSDVCTFTFKGADGIPQTLSLENIHFLDESNMPKTQQPLILTFAL